MSDGDLQHIVSRAVVDGQGKLDGGDLDIAHDAGIVDAQLCGVVFALRVGKGEEAAARKESAVIGVRACQQRIVAAGIHAAHLLVIGGDGPRGVQGVPIIAHAWVEQQGQPCKERDDQQRGGDFIFHCRVLLAAARDGREDPSAPCGRYEDGEKLSDRTCSCAFWSRAARPRRQRAVRRLHRRSWCRCRRSRAASRRSC